MRFQTSGTIPQYVRKMTELRKQAQASGNAPLAEFVKLMVNSIYGKTIENMTKRSDIRLLVDALKARRLVEKPHCIGFQAFSDDLMAVEMRKVKALINKPFEVLDWSMID